MQKSSGTDFNALSGTDGAARRLFRVTVQSVLRCARQVLGISGKEEPLEQAETTTDKIKGMGSDFRPFPSYGDGAVTNEHVNKLKRELGV